MMYFKGIGHVALYCKAIGVTVSAYGLTRCAGILPTYCARWGLTPNSYSAMTKRRQTQGPSRRPSSSFFSVPIFYSFQQRGFNWLSLWIFTVSVLGRNFPHLTEKHIWMSSNGESQKSVRMGLDNYQQWGSTAQHRELYPSSWDRPWWKIIWEKEKKYIYTHTHLWLGHCDVEQKWTQHCEKKFFLKNYQLGPFSLVMPRARCVKGRVILNKLLIGWAFLWGKPRANHGEWLRW